MTRSGNAAGCLTSEDNSGTPGMPNVVLTHGYNAFRERTSRADNLGGSTAFTFDQAHRMTMYYRPLRGSKQTRLGSGPGALRPPGY